MQQIKVAGAIGYLFDINEYAERRKDNPAFSK